MPAFHLTDANFRSEILEYEGLAMVDFGAEWCAPCKHLAPIVDELAEEIGEGVKIAKLDIDQSRAIATEYGVMSVPTLLFFRSGERVDQLIGVQSKEVLKAKIAALLPEPA